MISSPGSLRTRLFLAFTLVTLIAVALPAGFIRSTLYKERMEQAGQQALAHASLAKAFLDSSPDESQALPVFRAAGDLSFRMTRTDPSGRVIMDSHTGTTFLPDLDNHADRPEIEAAALTGSGVSLRFGNSLGYEAVYAAVLLDDGGILRVAVPVAEIRRSLEEELSFLALVALFVGLFCILLAAMITRNVQRGVNNMAEVVGEIARARGRMRLHDVPAREFLPLAEAVNAMADSIEDFVTTTNDQRGQLETILDSMHEGVLVLGPSGLIRHWNRALSQVFPNVAGAVGRPLIEGVPVPALQYRVEELIGTDGLELQTISSGSSGGEAVHFELPSGRFYVAHLSRPMHSLESLGLVIVLYDATEIMQLGRIRKDFVSNVSHELRTPLTAIRGYAETLLMAEDIKDDYRAFVKIIHDHSASLSRIVSDLLSLARIENDQETIEVHAIDARTALEQALAACREEAVSKNISFKVDLCPAPVLANSTLLVQVFRNLLENACRYTPENGVVDVTSVARAGEVLFTVSDHGPGIPQEALARIFERFFQVRPERNSGSSGVGLAICKHIIERHGGRIWAESPRGLGGTAIYFTLPAASGIEQ